MIVPPSWERVQALFLEALDLDPGPRELLLQRADTSEPEVAREVRSLLAAHQGSGPFLTGSASEDLHRIPRPGSHIGPYRILEEIGRGGMGIVFRATRDDEDFTKEVAIKLIYPGFQSAEILERFRSERRIQAKLNHPLIASLIDGGTMPDGRPYLVMDHVSGEPLVAWCDGRRLDTAARLRLFVEVCDAVQFAHRHLIIHRDLKPDNVLVTESGSPRLLDFGIAKVLSPPGDGSRSPVTAPFHRMMTLDYASPEQIRGEPVTLTSDIYSLGVILYELLTGAKPISFRDSSPEGIVRALGEDPPAPSVILARRSDDQAADRRGTTTLQLRRRLAGDLDVIVLKALDKEPSRRYASVDQFAQDIRRHLEGLPVLARGHSTTYLLSRFVRRHRAVVMTAGLVLASLVAGLVGTTWQAGVARRQADLATRRFNDVRSLAHTVMFDIHDSIAGLPGSTRAREALVDHAILYLQNLGRDVKGDPDLEHELGVAWSKMGDVQGQPFGPNLGRSEDALASYATALTFLNAAAEARPDSFAYARNLVVTMQRNADLLMQMGRDREAMDGQRTALARIEALQARYPGNSDLPGDLLLSRDRLGDWLLAAGDTTAALREREFCMNLAEAQFRADPTSNDWRRSMIINCCKTADLQAARNDREQALAAYQRAATLGSEAVAVLGRDTQARRDLSIVYGQMGLFLAGTGDLDSGLAVYDRGMQLSEEMAAEDPDNALMQSDLAAGHFEIGTMLLAGGKYTAAEARFQEAHDRFSRLAAADTMNIELREAAAQCAQQIAEIRRRRG